MKQVLVFVALVTSLSTYSQEEKTTTLVVSGQGQTQDEARDNALRSAIEQAFGAFISSKTEILTDALAKDEILSVANGNIQKYEVISEVQIPNGQYATSLKATVSVTNLTSFVESKGVIAEFKGNLFALNVKQQVLNETNEIKAIENLFSILQTLSDASFDYSLKVSDPISADNNNEKWIIPLSISVSANKNLASLSNYLYHTLKGISLSTSEVSNYIQLGKSVFPVSISIHKNEYDYILLRKESSIKILVSMLYYFNHSIQNFTIDNGIDEFRISSKSHNNLTIDDEKFRPFIVKVGKCMSREMYTKGSVFFEATGSNGYQKVTMSENPILQWRDWSKLKRQWRGCGFGWSEFYEGFDFRAYATQYPYSDFFQENFIFLNNLSEKMLNGYSGLVIDFSDIPLDKELITITLNDLRSLQEIDKITEYKVLPILD